MIRKLQRLFLIIFILSNIIFLMGEQSSDDLFSEQWNLRKVDMPEAWNITKGSSSVKIAVIGLLQR